jgi:hypothetical protein
MRRKLYIFDFDDTLVSSNALIKIIDPMGNEARVMTSEEYADRASPKHITDEEISLGFVEDFSDFEIYPPDAEVIKPNFSAFLDALNDESSDVYVITARGNPTPVEQFLSDNGASGFEVLAVGGADPSLKGRALVNIINTATEPYGSVEVYEDSAANLQAMERAVQNNPDITFQGNLVHLSKESLLRRFISSLISETFAVGS